MGARAGTAWATCQVRGPDWRSPIAYSKKLTGGERPQAGPCPSHPPGDKKDEAREQFMGRKADWIIHMSQQRWHLAAQKPLPSGWS